MPTRDENSNYAGQIKVDRDGYLIWKNKEPQIVKEKEELIIATGWSQDVELNIEQLEELKILQRKEIIKKVNGISTIHI